MFIKTKFNKLHKLVSNSTDKKRVSVLILFIIVFIFGYSFHQEGLYQKIEETIFTWYLKSIGYEIDEIGLDIKFKELQKLRYKKDLTFSAKYFGYQALLFANDNDYVSGAVEYKGKKYKAKLRLKGDYVDHLKGKKWSFRVKLSNSKSLFGLKKFSIHRPGTRHYLYEWIYTRLLEYEGLPAIKYKFINVSINGESLGVYALEEHFDKILVEHNGLREGPIIKCTEQHFWADKWLNPDKEVDQLYQQQMSEILPFKYNKTIEVATQKQQFIRAKNLYEAFRQGKLPPSRVFDVDKMASFIAVSNLTNSWHALMWSNLRFYYNPVTCRLEPIGFDGFSGRGINRFSVLPTFIQPYSIHNYLYKDEILNSKTTEKLYEIANANYIDSFFSFLNRKYSINFAIIPGFLNRIMPGQWVRFCFYNKETINHNYNVLKNHFKNNKIEGFISVDKKNNLKSLVLKNTTPFCIAITNIKHNDYQTISKQIMLKPYAQIKAIQLKSETEADKTEVSFKLASLDGAEIETLTIINNQSLNSSVVAKAKKRSFKNILLNKNFINFMKSEF